MLCQAWWNIWSLFLDYSWASGLSPVLSPMGETFQVLGGKGSIERRSPLWSDGAQQGSDAEGPWAWLQVEVVTGTAYASVT